MEEGKKVTEVTRTVEPDPPVKETTTEKETVTETEKETEKES